MILSKYLDHRPLYRVQQELGRHGVEVTRSTLSDWVNAVASALERLQKRLRQDLVGGDYLQVDESPVKVLDPDLPGRTANGWLWVYARPGGAVLFDFQSGRGREGPDNMLRDFRGTFQTDGYALYESMERQRADLRRVGCWAHARRKFHEALEDDGARAREFILLIGKMYAVEREARERALTSDARKALRAERVPEVLARLRRRLEELEPGKVTSPVLLKSPLGMAIRYTLGQWEALVRYLEDGRYEMDNNLVENAIRPTAVGKNYAEVRIMRSSAAMPVPGPRWKRPPCRQRPWVQLSITSALRGIESAGPALPLVFVGTAGERVPQECGASFPDPLPRNRGSSRDFRGPTTGRSIHGPLRTGEDAWLLCGGRHGARSWSVTTTDQPFARHPA